MVSDEQIHEAVRLAMEASQQYVQRHGPFARPAPALRLNQQGVLEVFDPFDEPDTHDEWRSMNAGLAPG